MATFDKVIIDIWDHVLFPAFMFCGCSSSYKTSRHFSAEFFFQQASFFLVFFLPSYLLHKRPTEHPLQVHADYRRELCCTKVLLWFFFGCSSEKGSSGIIRTLRLSLCTGSDNKFSVTKELSVQPAVSCSSVSIHNSKESPRSCTNMYNVQLDPEKTDGSIGVLLKSLFGEDQC